MDEGWAIGPFESGKWRPLTREQALAARDFSRAGETFIDYKGQLNEIQYSVLTPLGYQACVPVQAIKHLTKHAVAARFQASIPYNLNNPDLIVTSYEFPTVHLYYKAAGRILLVIAVHQKDNVRFVATMHDTPTIKGLREKKISQTEFLYVRGGFQWKKWT